MACIKSIRDAGWCPQVRTLRAGPMEPNDDAPATWNRQGRSLAMIKIKPPAKTENDPKQAAENASIKQIAENAVHGGPKDVKKDKRSGAGRGQKG